ncbi:hypothetical protein HDU78_011596 [Chytriomyces hyalinus]|nr:hypothetical protein HDU78_011596 [Chytriomyces hyalinus]
MDAMLKWLGINSTANAFDVQEQIGSGGPGNHWKAFTATKKGSSAPLKNSIFMLDKRSLRLSKEDVSNLSQLLKKDAQTLSRLRHPSLLQVSESANDSTGAIAARFDLDEVEIQKGILQVIKGLEFLHANNWTDASISPDSIYINAKGDSKIAGFAFAQCSNVGNSTFYLRDYPPFCSPTLDFMAPELVMDSRSNRFPATNASKRFVNPPPLSQFESSAFFDNILVSTIGFLESFVEKNQISKAQFLKGLVAVLPQFSLKLVHRKVW